MKVMVRKRSSENLKHELVHDTDETEETGSEPEAKAQTNTEATLSYVSMRMVRRMDS